MDRREYVKSIEYGARSIEDMLDRGYGILVMKE